LTWLAPTIENAIRSVELFEDRSAFSTAARYGWL